jgi:hypothetical protein
VGDTPARGDKLSSNTFSPRAGWLCQKKLKRPPVSSLPLALMVSPGSGFGPAGYSFSYSDPDATAAWLAQAIEARSREVILVGHLPALAGLKHHPRIAALLSG